MSTVGFAQAPPETTEAVVVERGRVKRLHHVVLAADRLGVIANDVPTEGDSVRKDAVVVELAAEVPRAALAVGEARAVSEFQVEAARKEFDVSKVELRMAEDANADVADAVPGIEVLRLQLTRDRNELRIDFAESERVIAELERDRLVAELDTFFVRSPIDGTVVKVHKSRGEAVQQGEPILEVTDTSLVRVEGYVKVADALRIQRGDEVVVRPRIDGLDRPAAELESTGRVVFVDLSVAVEQLQDVVLVWAEVRNPHGLLLNGLKADMSIKPGTAPVGRTVRSERE